MWEMEERDKNKFEENYEIVYQPQFDLNTYCVTGAEALVRMKGGDGKIYPPNCFIPRMEENDEIIELDLWVFDQVCQMIRDLHKKNTPVVPVSVNLSMRTVSNPFKIYELTMSVKVHEILLKDILIELTGTAPSPSGKGLEKSLEYIRDQGVGIILDDFGLGYAPLSLFGDTSFDKIKIDKYYLQKAGENQRKRTILKFIIQMAGEIGVDVICEGIETDMELELLRSMGCQRGQGYIFSQPVSAAELEHMLLTRPVCTD